MKKNTPTKHKPGVLRGPQCKRMAAFGILSKTGTWPTQRLMTLKSDPLGKVPGSQAPVPGRAPGWREMRKELRWEVGTWGGMLGVVTDGENSFPFRL